MIEKKRFLFLLLIIFGACSNPAEVRRTDPLESGRGFIEASLKGDYDEAQKYLLQDTTNLEYFEGYKKFINNRSKEEKKGYSEANIIIDSTEQLSDSVTLLYYSNTYKMKPARLKLVRRKGDWLVDFKYTLMENLEGE